MTKLTVTTLTTLATFLFNNRLPIKGSAVILLSLFGLLVFKFNAPTNAQPENPLPPFSETVVSKLKTIAMIGQVRANYPNVFTKVGEEHHRAHQRKHGHTWAY